MFIDEVFYLVSALLLVSVVFVLISQNVYRSAVFLAFSMLCFAALYFLMSAEFIGVIQILVYVGAVSVLIALSVMLVKDIEKSTESNIFLLAAIPIIIIFGVLMVFFIFSFKWDEYSNNILNDPCGLTENCLNQPALLIESTNWLGKLITADFMLAFQLSGVILLAALLGALALLRVRIKNDTK